MQETTAALQRMAALLRLTDPTVQNAPDTTNRAHEALKAGRERKESSVPMTSL
jgi:hypothetical protein